MLMLLHSRALLHVLEVLNGGEDTLACAMRHATRRQTFRHASHSAPVGWRGMHNQPAACGELSATRLCPSMCQPAMQWRLAAESRHALKGQHCGVLPRVHCSSSAGPGSGAAQSWCCWYCRFWTALQVADPLQRTALQLALLRHGQTGTWPHRPRPWFRAPQMATRPSSRARQKVTTHHWHALSRRSGFGGALAGRRARCRLSYVL